MDRFLGNIEAKTDAKGRVFVPAPFRKALLAACDAGGSGESPEECSVVLRRDVYQPCLVLYPMNVWNEELDRLTSRLSRYNPEHRMLLRQFMAEAVQVQLDANGRILIPRRLLQSAGISEAVRFLGMNETIEIWGAEQSTEPFMQPDEMMSRMAEILGGNL